MLMIEPTSTVRFAAGFYDSTSSRRLTHPGSSLFITWNKFQQLAYGCYSRRHSFSKNRVRASAEESQEAASSPIRQNAKPPRYHPFEDIAEADLMEGEDARLSPAETSRTVIEVNSKSTLLFSNLVSDEVHENIFWPDLPYVTDEYGNIYFQVKNDQDILQTLTAEDNLVQVIIGMDTEELLSELESIGSSEIDIGIEEFDDEDSDIDDEDDDDDDNDEDDGDDTDWVSVIEEEEDLEDLNESLGDWAKLATMRSSHPMYFAKKLVEVVSDDPLDYMDEPPPAGVAIQGLLRPAFIEDYSIIQKRISESNHKRGKPNSNQVGRNVEDKVGDLGIVNGDRHVQRLAQDGTTSAGKLENDETLNHGTSFYKLEMIKIQLISAHGHLTAVEVEDFRKSQPDAIAHSAANIISRLKAGGEKTTQALKSLCWRCKGIQVEEASVIGVDTLGFDMRICSGKQVETLRFTFKTRATSEYSAERQLNDLLFPRTHQKLENKKEAQQTEW